MYKILELDEEFATLDAAMKAAREYSKFVTIVGDGLEIVGVFGVDAVRNGLCPNGNKYTWYKRRYMPL